MLRIPHSLGILFLFLLFLFPAAAATPHGGQYKGPADANGGNHGSGGTLHPPTNPEGAAGAGPAVSSGNTSRSAGTRTGNPRSTRGGSERGSGAQTGSGLDGPRGDLGWETWWEHNKEAFLGLKQRLDRTQLTASGVGALTGRGPRAPLSAGRRPDPGTVEQELVPTLLAMLHQASDTDVLDSALLALARVAPAGRRDEAAAAMLPLLEHDELAVQSSAALALGVLGPSAGAACLPNLLQDNSEGRRLCGGGAVHWLVRSFAALSLGLLGDDQAVDVLMDVAERLRGSEQDVRLCAFVALGLLGSEHPRAAEVGDFLVRKLQDRHTPPLTAAFIPTALGRLGRHEALDALTATFADRDSDLAVVQSTAIALGQLATLADTAAVAALRDYVAEGQDAPTRHFALIALGQIGARDARGESGAGEARGGPDADGQAALDADGQAALVELFTREIAGKGKSRAHRSWAALGAAIHAREAVDRQPEMIEKLRAAYEKESDPAFRGAFAIALGLLADRSSGERVFADLLSIHDESFRGYACVALGFMDHRPAADTLRGFCQQKTTPPNLRLQAATGLGLLADAQAVPVLIDTLERAETLGVSTAAAKALGLIGDRDSLQPLLRVAQDETRQPLTRAFATVALGLLAERSDLPFNAVVSMDHNYFARAASLLELFDIL